MEKKKRHKIRKLRLFLLLFLIFLVAYPVIGFIFTILRSNAHYDYFVKGDYWQERCLKFATEASDGGKEITYTESENAGWCYDKYRNFVGYKPDIFYWYTNMFYYGYPGYNGGFLSTLFFWPLHFIGVDMIHFEPKTWFFW